MSEPPLTERENAELTRIADAFANWGAKEGILSRITEEQCADLAKAFAAGCMYALRAEREAWSRPVFPVTRETDVLTVTPPAGPDGDWAVTEGEQ
jgi:hypothetical protein